MTDREKASRTCETCVHSRWGDYDMETGYQDWSCDREDELPDDYSEGMDCPCWAPYAGSERELEDKLSDEAMYRSWLEDQE